MKRILALTMALTILVSVMSVAMAAADKSRLPGAAKDDPYEVNGKGHDWAESVTYGNGNDNVDKLEIAAKMEAKGNPGYQNHLPGDTDSGSDE